MSQKQNWQKTESFDDWSDYDVQALVVSTALSARERGVKVRTSPTQGTYIQIDKFIQDGKLLPLVVTEGEN